MKLRTCVDPSGKFVYGRHQPCFTVANLRENDYIGPLGRFADGAAVQNQANFPPGDVNEPAATMIYEIPNPFPFRGVTYISENWAAKKAKDPSSIMLPPPKAVSFTETLEKWFGKNQLTPEKKHQIFNTLPAPLQLAIAETATDPEDVVSLARIACKFVVDPKTGRPDGLLYHQDESGAVRPVINDAPLYEVIANNPHLPDVYKRVMVLTPGVQGKSEIVGEWTNIAAGGNTHVFEYLRRNSYIPWGHYAANMAHDAVRYRVEDLSETDMHALRHLYYQRTFIRLARSLNIPAPCDRGQLSQEALENLRREIVHVLKIPGTREKLVFNRTLWGWNFGFDYAPSHYRLHASHQQIHQQYALVPAFVENSYGLADAKDVGSLLSAYACGDLMADFIRQYKAETGRDFFDAYISAIRNNQRMDRERGESSLVIYQDDQVLLFVPKAQTSQWEVQLMTRQPVGNVLEADLKTRRSIDRAILAAVQTLEKLGAKMITTIEYSKAFEAGPDLADQRLLYAFLPRLPESPGAFSEAQMRWINGHYPEDFAAACRAKLTAA